MLHLLRRTANLLTVILDYSLPVRRLTPSFLNPPQWFFHYYLIRSNNAYAIRKKKKKTNVVD
jgi:hypothetical protein